MADIEILVGFDQAKKANQEILRIGSNAQKSASVFQKAFSKVESEQRKQLANVRQQVTASQRLERQKQREADIAAKASQREAAAQRQLRMEYQQGYATFASARAEMRRLNQAKQNGIITADRYAKEIRELRTEYQAFTTQANDVTMANNRFARQVQVGNVRSMNNLGVAMQQSGYQIGDFLVQVQSGTNWMVAFGQQATQLVGILPMFSQSLGMSATRLIAISAGLGIVIPLVTALGGAYMRTRDDGTDALTDIEQAVKDLTEATEALRNENDLLSSSYSNLGRLRAQEALTEVTRELVALEEKYAGVSERKLARTAGVDAARLKTLREQSEQLKEQIDSYDDQIKRQTTLNNISENFSNTLESLSMDNLLAQFDILNVKLGSAIFGAGTLIGRLNAAWTTALAVAQANTLDPNAPRQQSGPRPEFRRGLKTTTANIPGSLGESYVNSLPRPPSGGGGGGGGGGAAQPDPREMLKALEDELRIKRLLIGVNEQQAEAIKLEEELKKKLVEVGQTVTDADRERIQTLTQEAQAIRDAVEAEKRRTAELERFEKRIEDAVVDMAKTADSIEDVFLGLLQNILEEFYRAEVAKPVSNVIGNLVSGVLGGGSSGRIGSGVSFSSINANGNVFSGGKVVPFANGGVVSSPTLFPMRGSNTGLMGEAGPEAIIPLKRGPDGKLGVATSGNAGNVVVHQSFNFSANGDDSVKKIIAQEAPKIAKLTQNQILDSRSRGGTFRKTFR